MKDPKEVPTLPAPPSLPTEYKVARTPLPRGVRRISGSIVLRFEQALENLDAQTADLDEVRKKARKACAEDEEDRRCFQPSLIDEDEKVST